MKSKKNNKKSLLRKFFKILLWLITFTLLLLITALIIIRIKFPPNELKRIIASEISKAANNRHAEIGNVRLNPFKGFVVDDITIYESSPKDSTAINNKKFVTIEKVYLKYKLSSLLKRTIKIKEIVIDQPKIHLTINKQQSNFDDLIAPSPPTGKGSVKVPSDTSTTPLSLPIALELDKFKFKNFSAFVSSESETTTIKAEVNNLSVIIKDLSIPHGSWNEIKDDVKANLKIVSPNSPWKFYVESIYLKNSYELHTQFDLNIDLIMQGIADLRLKGKAGFDEIYLKESNKGGRINKIPVTKLISLTFNLQIDGENEKINIEELTTQLADERALSIHGIISNLSTEPHFALSVDESEIRLSKLVNALKTITPLDYRNRLEDLKIDGILSFRDTEIYGNPASVNIDEGLVFKVYVNLDEFYASYPSPKTNINGLSLNFRANGLYDDRGLINCKLDGKINFLALNSDINDSIKINIKNFATDFLANISNEYFPTVINLKTQIGDVFGAPINFDLNFDAKENLKTYLAHATLDVSNLNIANLPQSYGTGLLNSNVSLSSSSLDKIILGLNFSTDSLYLPLESEQLIVSPIKIKGLADVAIDTNFQNINLNHFNLSANNFLSMKGQGKFQEMGEKGFQVVLDSFVIRHKEVFDFLPKLLKKELENLMITGTTTLTAEATGKIPQIGKAELFVKANIDINAQIDDPDIPITIGALTGKVKLSSDGTTADILANIDIDSLISASVRDQSLNNSSLNLICHLPEFDQARVDRCLLTIPDLNSKLTLTGKVDSLRTNPSINLDLLYTFSAPDSVLMIRDLYMLGNLDTKINLQIQQPLVTINGEINLSKINAYLANQIIVQDISGTIPFLQKFDNTNAILINDDYLADVGAVNYNLLRPYYSNKSSYLKVKNIRIADYEISNFIMDVYLGNGRIEIPHFALNLYDGNMMGNIFADFGEGDLTKINYYIKANISRLNSAKLSPIGAGSAKTSELNMNMELKGLGLDPAKDLDFNGYLYITKIGSKFADNVLNSLDPKGTDKSIQDTKKLLKWGYKPKLISFEIKHGYLYPSIYLVKGNFFTKLIPLNLSGGKIELARIPIKFFLETQLTQAN